MYGIPPHRMTSVSLPPAHNQDFLVEPQEAVSLRDYWTVISKYRRTIVAFAFLGVTIASIFLFSTPPTYTATATLFIENKQSNILGATQSFLYGGIDVEHFYKTQQSLLESRSLVARVIQTLGFDNNSQFQVFTKEPPSWLQRYWQQAGRAVRGWIHDTGLLQWLQGWFTLAGTEKTPETFELGVHPELIKTYLQRLKITTAKESQLVRVGFTSLDPSFSKEVANTHATTFIRTSLLTRFELTAGARQFLEERLAELKEKLAHSEEMLNRFRKAHAIVALDKGEDLVAERLKGLNNTLTQARARRIELESLHRVVQQRDYRHLSQLIDNPAIQRMKERISTLELEHSRLATTYRPTHPSVSALQTQIGEARGHLDQELRRLVRTIASDFNAAKTREEALGEAMEKERQAALDLREKAIEGAILEREVESNRMLYETVLRRAKETDLTGEVPFSNMRLIDAAELPLKPDTANRPRILLLSCVVGLLGGIGLAFLRHYLDNTVKTPEDVARLLRLPTLGIVTNIGRPDRRAPGLGYRKNIALPRVSESQGREQQGLVVPHHPLSFVSEAYHTICTALRFSRSEQPPRTILITSAQPREGKTVTAINIAVNFARSGAQVLLIDADLRKGNCHQLLDMPNTSGLTNILTGNPNDGEPIKPTAITNLFLLSRGESSPNPAALLSSERTGQLLESLVTKFAFIIIDSAPLLPITETLHLATKVDGVVLVIKGQQASLSIVHQAYHRLVYVKSNILGVILNNIDIQSPEYREYKSSYISYYNTYVTENTD
jgi:succinoglycan biosynthesis transport protein ExoP